MTPCFRHWCTGKGGLPLRLLDNFTVSGGKRGSQLTGLEALDARGGTSLTLRGALLPAAGRSAKRDGEQAGARCLALASAGKNYRSCMCSERVSPMR